MDVFRDLDLEDHLETLENSLTSIKPGANNGRKNSDYRGADSIASRGSPYARQAMGIRTRQQHRPDSTNLQSGFSRGRLADSDRLNSGIGSRGKNSAGKGRDNSNEKKPPLRLDAEGLQNYYAKGKRDFASHDLRSLSLIKANLEGANFHQANLSKINLQGANLFNADFGKATLNQANLRDANLGKAYMSNADLEGADLRGADLSGAYLLNANLRGANLCGTNLSSAKVTEEQLATARINWMTTRPNGKRGIW